MVHAFTIDLEEWFCSHNLQGVVQYEKWHEYTRRVEINSHYLLDQLDNYDIKATFFVLGWIAEHYPYLIKEIAARGHEIGTHGYKHRLVTQLSKEEFRQDLTQSIDILTALTEKPILGFRAPAFSITEKTMWATDIIKEVGLVYDSSVYPIAHHPDYGIPDAPLELFKYDNGLVEIPMSCVQLGNKRIPCSGGAYFRIFPYWFYKKLITKLINQKRPLIFYLHPWELDPDTPRLELPRVASFRHYTKLSRTKNKLDKLFSELDFVPLAELYNLNQN